MTLEVSGLTDKYRVIWREDPAHSVVIAWNQISGSAPTVHLDYIDFGQDAAEYEIEQSATRVVQAKGMKNHFARIYNLKSNTVYFFVIRDSEGVSRRMSFQTAAADSYHRISIIAGGDSRNNRPARKDANLMVSKLRPHCVMFGGDMTAGDTADEWIEWFDDWQLTCGGDGRLTPIIATRGNHESENKTLVDLFDIPSNDAYYALTLGGNLLRIYTLNTLIAPGGNQVNWLQKDLASNQNVIWKTAQYHHAIRPHTKGKKEKTEQQVLWAPLFQKYGVNLVVESDAHVVKTTWPIRPSNEAGSEEGFIRDDENGTVYVGEGCWGAPLRENNDNKNWTRASESFNQFKWIFVDEEKIEVRTIKTDGAALVNEINPDNIFKTPIGLNVWNPINGDVITIYNKSYQEIEEEPVLAYAMPSSDTEQEDIFSEKKGSVSVDDFRAFRRGPDVLVKWATKNETFKGILFELQRSIDNGQSYVAVGHCDGHGGEENDYQIADFNAASDNPGKYISYRLFGMSSDRRDTIVIISPNETKEFPPPGPKKKSPPPPLDKWKDLPLIKPNDAGDLKVAYHIDKPARIAIVLINPKFQEMTRLEVNHLRPGQYSKVINLNNVPNGKYMIVIKANKELLRRYRVLKDI